MAAAEGRAALEGSLAAAGAPVRGADAFHQRADGTPVPVSVTVSAVTVDGAVTGLSCVIRDVTAQRVLEERLRRQALTDPPTGLSNRVHFTDRLDHAVSRRAAGREPAVVGVLDLDGFKAVNDTLGHEAGDRLLWELAARLSGVVRPSDTVARLGGDEFALLLEDVPKASIDEAAERILAAVTAPVALTAVRTIQPRVSLGLCSVQPGDAGDDVLRRADAAMYDAKAGGGGHRCSATSATSRSTSSSSTAAS